jgi:DNA-directed RNA polymerase specialized sigma24 family protein
MARADPSPTPERLPEQSSVLSAIDYFNLIRREIRKHLHSPGVNSDDLFGEAEGAVAAGLLTYDPANPKHGPPAAYLTVCIKHALSLWCKKEGKRVAREKPLSEHAEPVSTAPGPGEVSLRDSFLALMDRVLAGRQLKVMKLLADGWLVWEIALELHIKETTVSVHKGRAIATLRKHPFFPLA